VFGSLGIIAQSIGAAKIIVKVPPTAFDPQPKVDSAVFLIEKSADRSDKEFEDMLRVAFTQPRKTLMKNLSAKYEKPILLEAFEALHLTLTVRPHQVPTQDYHQLYKIIRSLDGRRNKRGNSEQTSGTTQTK
jgi:16S rRNA (adenine1518-N6/adenine1519-N6)-dimethyltransferase